MFVFKLNIHHPFCWLTFLRCAPPTPPKNLHHDQPSQTFCGLNFWGVWGGHISKKLINRAKKSSDIFIFGTCLQQRFRLICCVGFTNTIGSCAGTGSDDSLSHVVDQYHKSFDPMFSHVFCRFRYMCSRQLETQYNNSFEFLYYVFQNN